MKKIPFIQSIFALFAVTFLFLANASNPPNGRTGAPLATGGNEALCSSCHAGNSLNLDGNLAINGLPSVILPNTTYPLSVDITKTAGDIYRAGFQLVVLDDNHQDVSTINNTDNNTTVTSYQSRNYIEHNGAQIYGPNTTVSYTFDWTSPNNISGNNINFYAVTVLGNGSGSSQDYSFTNYTTYPFNSQALPLSVSLSPQDAYCNGDLSGSITATPTGGTGIYTYTWSNGQTGMTASGLSAGTYSLTITSGSETAISTATVNEPPLFSLAVTSTNISCINPTGTASAITTGGTGNITISWDNGETGDTAVNLEAGMHTVTATDSNGCASINNFNIQDDATPPTAEAGANVALSCINSTVQLNGTASSMGNNISYQWVSANGNIVSGATTPTPIVDAAGTYSLTVTNNTNGCNATDFVFVTADGTPPTADAGADLVLDCLGTPITLQGSSSPQSDSYSLIWTTEDGNILDFPDTVNPIVNAPGTYCLTITSNTTGCVATDCMVISLSQEPTIFISEQNNVSCYGGNDGLVSLQAENPNGNYSYSWSNGATTNSIGNLSAGVYNVMVMNNDSQCSSSLSIEITEANELIATTTTNNESAPNANDGSAMVAVTGGTPPYNYLWSTGETTSQISNLSQGTYSVTVTDMYGCSVVSNDIITGADCQLTITTTSTNPLCHNESTGQIIVQTTGGTAPFLYLWSNNETTSTIDNLSHGTYTVTVSDSNDCTATSQVTIANPPMITLQLVYSINAGCSGSNTGMATVEAMNGTAPYTYNWSNGMTGSTVNALAPDTYTTTATDSNGCTSEAITVVIENETESDTTAPTVITQDISIYLNENGTAGISTDMIDNGSYDNCGFVVFDLLQSSFDCSDIGENTVTLYVNDSNGNFSTDTAIVTVIDTIPPTMICPTTYEVDCQNIVTYEFIADDQCNEYILSATHFSGMQFPVGTTLVTMTNTDLSGNTADCSFEIEIINDVIVCPIGSVTNVSCHGGSDGSITINPQGGVPPYGISTNDEPTLTNLSAGFYNITVSDSQGCSTIISATVTEPENIDVQATITPTNSQNTGAIDITVTGGTSPYAYAWTSDDGTFTATTEDIDMLATGNYTLSLTDANGCEVTFTFVVELELAAESISWKTAIHIQPNPTQDIFFVEMPSNVKAIQFELLSIDGKLLQQNQNVSSNSTSFDISRYANGLYLLKVITAEGTALKKLIKE